MRKNSRVLERKYHYLGMKNSYIPLALHNLFFFNAPLEKIENA